MRVMVNKQGHDVDVDDEHFEAAMQEGYEPAMEFVEPKSGKTVVVRDQDAEEAKSQGLMFKPDYQNKQTGPTLKVGAGEAAGRGFANTGTFGFVDEIQGGLGAAKKGFSDLTSGKGFDTEGLKAAYRGSRNAYRMVDDAAYDQNKLAYLAGGAVPLLLGGGAGAAAKGLGAAAKLGAVQGGLGALGAGTDLEGQADLTRGEYGKAALQTGLGAALGGGLGAGAEKLTSSVVPKLIKNLRNIADERAAKSISYAAPKSLEKSIKRLGGSQQFGKELVDLGIVSGKKSYKDILNAAESSRKSSGENIGEIISSFDDANQGGLDVGKEVLQSILARLKGEVVEPLNSTAANQDLARQLQGGYIKDLEKFASKFQPKEVIQEVENPLAAQLGSMANKPPTSTGSNPLDDLLSKTGDNKLAEIMAKVKARQNVPDAIGDDLSKISGAMKTYKDDKLYAQEAKDLSKWLGVDEGGLNRTLKKAVEVDPGPSNYGFKDLQNELTELDKKAYSSTGGLDSRLNEQIQKARKIIKQEMLNAAEEVMKDTDPAALKNLSDAKRKYAISKTASRLAEQQVDRVKKNRSVSLTDYLSGAGGLAAGSAAFGPIGGLAGMTAPLVNKVARERGNQAVVGASKALSDLLKKNPELLGKLLERGTVPASFMINGK